MMTKPRYLKGADGKFKGSTGERQSRVPTAPENVTPFAGTKSPSQPTSTVAEAYTRFRDLTDVDPKIEAFSSEDALVAYELFRSSHDEPGAFTATLDAVGHAHAIVVFERMSEASQLEVARLCRNPEVLAHLAEYYEDNQQGMSVLAENTSTPEDTLYDLYEMDSAPGFARVALSTNPSTPTYLLDKLAHDRDVCVRYGVAQNPSTNTEQLNTLLDYAEDEKGREDQMLNLIAAHKNTSPPALNRLAHIGHTWVKMSVAKNRNTDADTLAYLASTLDSDTQLGEAIASHPNAIADTL